MIRYKVNTFVDARQWFKNEVVEGVLFEIMYDLDNINVG